MHKNKYADRQDEKNTIVIISTHENVSTTETYVSNTKHVVHQKRCNGALLMYCTLLLYCYKCCF